MLPSVSIAPDAVKHGFLVSLHTAYAYLTHVTQFQEEKAEAVPSSAWVDPLIRFLKLKSEIMNTSEIHHSFGLTRSHTVNISAMWVHIWTAVLIWKDPY